MALQSTSPLICDICLKELKRYSSFRLSIIEKHQELEVQSNIKIEYVPVELDTFVIKTECPDNDANCFGDNTDDFESAQYEDIPSQSSAAFSEEPSKNRLCLVTCEMCGKAMKSGSIYNHNKRFHTSDPFKFECDFCDKKYYKKDLLMNHLKTHNHQAAKTQARTTRRNGSAEHVKHQVRSHHRFKKIRYTIKAKSSKARQDLVACAYCGKMIKLCSLHNHTTRFHVNDPLKFSCDQCDRKFYKKDILAKHLMIHIPDEFRARSFKCNACSQTFIRLNALRSHEASKHATRKLQPVECHCGKTFKSKESLMWHNKRTHKRHEYEKTCKLCGKIVPDSTALKSHIQVYHTEGGMCNFMCDVCGKFYHRQFELTKHEKSHAEKSFACNLGGCGKKFLRIQQLDLHTKITHMNLKEFACSHIGCIKKFSTNQRLLRHIKISHENIKEKCPVIGCA